MKKIIIATLIFVYTLIGINNANASTYINDDLNNHKIEQLVVNVPSRVCIYAADSFGINIRTKDIEMYNNIKYKIEDDILYIDLNDEKYLEDNHYEPNDIRINIQVPNNIKKIRTNSNLLVAIVEKNNKSTNNEKN